MKRFKQIVLRLFLVGEMLVFFYTYVFGVQGLCSMFVLQQECYDLEQDIQVLNNKIKTIKTDIITWQHDPFYKEKLAREQLGMAYMDERVYVID